MSLQVGRWAPLSSPHSLPFLRDRPLEYPSGGQVDQWLEFSSVLVSGAGLESACAVINDYLSLRTFLVDYSVTAADVACWGQLQGETSCKRPW